MSIQLRDWFASGVGEQQRYILAIGDLTMTLQKVEPKHIHSSGSAAAQKSFSERVLCFGYHTIPHEACERRGWDEVRKLLSPDRRSESALTAGVNEIRAFYELEQTAFGSLLPMDIYGGLSRIQRCNGGRARLMIRLEYEKR
jgi:hypothetical protein